MAARKNKESAGPGRPGTTGRWLLWLVTMIVIAAGVTAVGYFVVDHYQTVRQARPWLVKATRALAAGRAAEAKRFAVRALSLDPGNAAALGILSQLRRDKRTSGDWLTLLAAAAPRPRPPAIDPALARRVADLLLQADKALATGDLKSAARHVARALKLAPNNQAARQYLAALGAARRAGFARRACPKPQVAPAPAAKPSATEVRRWLLSASEALLNGRLSQARDSIGRALKADPENPAAQRLLFEIVSDQRRLAGLLGRIKSLLDNRDLGRADRTVRRALSMDQKNQAAKAWLTKIEGLKRRVGGWLAQARAALEQGRLGAAYQLYTRVRDLDVNNSQLRRGLSLLRAGLRPDDIFTAIKDNNLPLLSAVLYAHPGAVASRYRTGGAQFDGFMPLHLAAWRGSPEAAKILLNHGAVVEARVKRRHDFTPLHLAALKGRPAVTRLLVARGADLAVKDDQGRTPLDVAVDAGQQKLADLLTRLGAKATGTPKRIVNRLFAAAAAGDVKAMKRLATGKALASIKSKSIDEIKRIGRTFQSVAGLKIDGGKATAQVIFDVSKVMTDQERRQLKRQLPALRKMARTTTDPQARRNLEQKIADLEKGLVRVKVRLVKLHQRWLVADLEG